MVKTMENRFRKFKLFYQKKKIGRAINSLEIIYCFTFKWFLESLKYYLKGLRTGYFMIDKHSPKIFIFAISSHFLFSLLKSNANN